MHNLPLFTASALALNQWWTNFRCGGSKRPSSGRSGVVLKTQFQTYVRFSYLFHNNGMLISWIVKWQK